MRLLLVVTPITCNSTGSSVSEELSRRIDSNIGYVDCILLGDLLEQGTAGDHQASARVKVTRVLWGATGNASIEINYDRRFEAELESPGSKLLFLRRSEDEASQSGGRSAETREIAFASTTTWECFDVLTANPTGSALRCSVMNDTRTERHEFGTIEMIDLVSTVQHWIQQLPLVDVALVTTGIATWGYSLHGTGAWEHRGSTQSSGFASPSQLAAIETQVRDWIAVGAPTYIGQPGRSPDSEAILMRLATSSGACTVFCSTAAWDAHSQGGPGTYKPLLELRRALPGLGP